MAADEHSDRHCRVDVRPGDVSKDIDHSDDDDAMSENLSVSYK